MSRDQTTDDVTGHIIHLDDTRLVFLGQRPSAPDAWFIGFRNRDGNDTKLVLSREALAAVVKLASEPFKGARTHFPHKMRWRVVRNGDMEEINDAP